MMYVLLKSFLFQHVKASYTQAPIKIYQYKYLNIHDFIIPYVLMFIQFYMFYFNIHYKLTVLLENIYN